MPNIATTIYVNDEIYAKKYMPRKQEILKKIRSMVRKELGLKE